MSVVCPFCNREFPGDKVNSRHLSKCNPDSHVKVLPCLCGHESTSLTQMKRHRATCEVWAARDRAGVMRERVRATSLEKYGVEDAAQAPEVQARRAATNLERYGAENPFSKEASTFEKVQAASKENHVILTGADNPFSKPEVKAKIRRYWQETYGVNGPQQVPEIRQATRATNLGRYGVEEPLSSPVRREAIRATCEKVYGGPAPSCSPVVKEKQRQTNLAHYGVEWTNQDPDVRRRQLGTMEANYGGHYFASEQGKKVIRAAMLAKYGVWNPTKREGYWARQVERFRLKFRVDHPLQLEEFLTKRRTTNVERYGVTHPLQLEEFRAKMRATNLSRYGTIFPGLRDKGPNLLEQRVGKMCPTMLFMGDGKFWRWLPKLGHHKNPDFIFPGPDPTNPKKGVTKVAEVFGNFWHSRLFTGKAPFEHEQELIDAYAEIGITCLILWESEVKSDPKGAAERLLGFLAG